MFAASLKREIEDQIDVQLDILAKCLTTAASQDSAMLSSPTHVAADQPVKVVNIVDLMIDVASRVRTTSGLYQHLYLADSLDETLYIGLFDSR